MEIHGILRPHTFDVYRWEHHRTVAGGFSSSRVGVTELMTLGGSGQVVIGVPNFRKQSGNQMLRHLPAGEPFPCPTSSPKMVDHLPWDFLRTMTEWLVVFWGSSILANPYVQLVKFHQQKHKISQVGMWNTTQFWELFDIDPYPSNQTCGGNFQSIRCGWPLLLTMSQICEGCSSTLILGASGSQVAVSWYTFHSCL